MHTQVYTYTYKYMESHRKGREYQCLIQYCDSRTSDRICCQVKQLVAELDWPVDLLTTKHMVALVPQAAYLCFSQCGSLTRRP